MKGLPEEMRHDLIKLAVDRTTVAINSVAQLFPTPQEKVHLLIHVGMAVARGAAALMHDHIRDENGKQPPWPEVYEFIMVTMTKKGGTPPSDRQPVTRTRRKRRKEA